MDGLGYPLVLELTGGQVHDGIMLQNCLDSIFPAVLFSLTKPMVHGKTVNTLPTMTLTSVFRQSRTQLIHGTPISITTKKGILLNAFS